MSMKFRKLKLIGNIQKPNWNALHKAKGKSFCPSPTLKLSTKRYKKLTKSRNPKTKIRSRSLARVCDASKMWEREKKCCVGDIARWKKHIEAFKNVISFHKLVLSWSRGRWWWCLATKVFESVILTSLNHMNCFAQNLEINFKILFRICLETTQENLICESFNAILIVF